ncbi:MAG: hypothetical protein HY262_04765, partial [Chloroflexi bacterium]|nr:hypothetical protein [Chloroflexota bacterium]
MRIDRRLLGWGAFLVIAGAIPLAVRVGAISAGSLSGWPSLWPLLLVGAGLSLVLRRTPAHLLGGAVSVLTAGVMVGGLLASGFNGIPSFGACGTNGNGTAFTDRSGSLLGSADVAVEFNCGHLTIGTADGSGWMITGSGPAGREPEVSADASRVRVTPPEAQFGWNDPASRWNVTIPRSPAVDLSVTLNAGEGDIDLSQATVDGLSVTLNAGSLNADLANASSVADIRATINAGSAAFRLPPAASRASVTLNAGSAKVCLPSGT